MMTDVWELLSAEARDASQTYPEPNTPRSTTTTMDRFDCFVSHFHIDQEENIGQNRSRVVDFSDARRDHVLHQFRYRLRRRCVQFRQVLTLQICIFELKLLLFICNPPVFYPFSSSVDLCGGGSRSTSSCPLSGVDLSSGLPSSIRFRICLFGSTASGR